MATASLVVRCIGECEPISALHWRLCSPTHSLCSPTHSRLSPLAALPTLSLPSLVSLDISRNWLRTLPSSLSSVPSLQTLTASHNMLRPGPSLNLETLSLLSLTSLDLTCNQKCGNSSLIPKIRSALPSLATLLLSISFPPPPGSYVGACAADRDPKLLRSQIEPWPTSALRRRIACDFGGDVLPESVGRPEVMEELLRFYSREQPRALLRAKGTRLEPAVLAAAEAALLQWSASFQRGNLERTSVNAEHYMILTSPVVFEHCPGSKKASQAASKLRAHRPLWDAAMSALSSVDADFARRCTAVACTHNFKGSPHIDKQNVGPFYGLSVGPEPGTGGIVVEASARVTVEVDTVGRLGKVDGRYPHWVAPYEGERWSLIFYRTLGRGEEVGPAVLSELSPVPIEATA